MSWRKGSEASRFPNIKTKIDSLIVTVCSCVGDSLTKFEAEKLVQFTKSCFIMNA